MITEIKDFKFLNDDLTFKFVFSHAYILEYFINLFLDYINSNLKFNITNVEAQTYIMPNNKTISLYYGDLVANLSNGTIISLEMYKNNFTLNDYNKSYAYKCRIFANQLKKVKKNKINYQDMKQVISLNLIKGNFNKSNNKIINCYRFKNDNSNTTIKDNTIIYLVRFDIVEKIEYNENEHKFISLLRLINGNNINDLKKYANGDEIMEDIIDYVFEWNKESSKNGLERLIEDRSYEAELKGELAGENKGITKRNFEIAKNMLKLDISLDNIHKATGLSKKEILNIK